MNRGRALSPVLLGALALALSACSRESSPPPPPAPSAAPPPPSTPWCGEGYRALSESVCAALPDRLASPPSVVVYLHGILAPDALPTEEQQTVLAAARAHGFAAIFPRGRAGLCTWDPKLAGHSCWPTRQETVDEAGPSILASLAEAEARAEDLAGVRFERRYLVGFSNGGYFAAFLTVEGRYRVDGAAVIGAGRSAVDESLSGPYRPPFYLAVGEREATATRADADTLAHLLSLRGWPVEYVVHPGRGHELQSDDLASAWATWGRR